MGAAYLEAENNYTGGHGLYVAIDGSHIADEGS